MWFPDVVFAREACCLFSFKPFSYKALAFVVCTVETGLVTFMQISGCATGYDCQKSGQNEN